MKIYLTAAFIFLSLLTNSILAQSIMEEQMTLEKMDSILTIEAEEIDGEGGTWQLFYGNRVVFILTDPAHNRMRIFTPIGAEQDLEVGQQRAMLEANFHAALDAKYSLYNGFIVSVFTHPLQELTPNQLKDALSQVVALANNFGSSYSSTDLIFGSSPLEENFSEEGSSEKRINQKPSKKN